MKVMIFTASPNKDGLTANCRMSASQGIKDAEAEVEVVRLNDLDIGKCQACSNGWGTCLEEHRCQVEDDFQGVHSSLGDVDAFILVTPVYWGEMSESAKAFTDRLRRCEATRKGKNMLTAKPVICVAAAGGSGGGVVSCLASMKRFISHVGAEKHDLIGITQKSRQYKLKTIEMAARDMVENLK